MSLGDEFLPFIPSEIKCQAMHINQQNFMPDMLLPRTCLTPQMLCLRATNYTIDDARKKRVDFSPNVPNIKALIILFGLLRQIYDSPL